MSPNKHEITAIAEQHIAPLKVGNVKIMGEELLRAWQTTDEQEFCKKTVLPRIQELRGRAKKKAMQVFRQIQSSIADVAAQRALAVDKQRRSAAAMHREILAAYEVINQQGGGIVYFGSARTEPGDTDYEEARALGRELATLLGVTSWSGAGPGQMEAPIRGAKEAGGRVAGIKIELEEGQSSFEQEVSKIFGPDEVAICKFFGPRKIGLVDAGMPKEKGDRRGFVFLPGGYGTLDELFEVVVLKQLSKIGSKEDVPIVLMNYDGYYDTLLQFLAEAVAKKKIAPDELQLITVCNTNEEAVAFFRERYGITSAVEAG